MQITCDGADDGEINTSAEGGVPPYTYTWTYEGDTIPNTEQTTDLTGLEPGEYTVTIADENDCKVTEIISIVEPTELILTAAAVEHAGGFEITCDGANDGEINTTIQGGVTPYTYTWTYEGNPIPNTEQTTDLTELEPGNYTVTVTDANGCDGDIFEIELIEPTAVTINATNLDYSGYGVSCLGASDGQINVTANGGVPTYNYIWSFQGDIVNEWEGSTEQINLLPGEYTIVAAVSYTHLTLPTIYSV